VGPGVTGTGSAGAGTPASTSTTTGGSGTVQQFPIEGGGGTRSGLAGAPIMSNGQQFTPIYDPTSLTYIGSVNARGKFVGETFTGQAPYSYQGGSAMQSTGAPATSGGSGSSGSILGPFLQNAWDAIQAEGAGANQLGGEGTQLFNEGQGMIGPANATIAEGGSILNQGQGMVNQATSGTGLYPSQQAFCRSGSKKPASGDPATDGE